MGKVNCIGSISIETGTQNSGPSDYNTGRLWHHLKFIHFKSTFNLRPYEWVVLKYRDHCM